MRMPQRHVTLDVAKGLGILFVVLGHNWLANTHGRVSAVIFSFHMPLFFFLSGVLLNTQESATQFLHNKTHSLLKPYAVVLIVVGICKGILADTPSRVSWFIEYGLGVLWGTGHSIAWPPLWFLPHLFICSASARCLLNLTAPCPPVLQATLFCLLLAFGSQHLLAFWDANRLIPLEVGLAFMNGLPWSADLLPVTTPFLLLGYVLREPVKAMTLHLPLLLGSILVFVGLHAYCDVSMNLNGRHYGQPLIATVQAGMGIYLCLSAAMLLQGSRLLTRWLSYCGARTLFILLFHGFIQNRVFQCLALFSNQVYINAFISFVFALWGSLLLFDLCKQSPWLSRLLLPHRPKTP